MRSSEASSSVDGVTAPAVGPLGLPQPPCRPHSTHPTISTRSSTTHQNHHPLTCPLRCQPRCRSRQTRTGPRADRHLHRPLLLPHLINHRNRHSTPRRPVHPHRRPRGRTTTGTTATRMRRVVSDGTSSRTDGRSRSARVPQSRRLGPTSSRPAADSGSDHFADLSVSSSPCSDY